MALMFLLPLVLLTVALNVAINALDVTDAGRALAAALGVVIQQIATSYVVAVSHPYFTDKVLGREPRLRESFREVRGLSTPVVLATMFSALLVLIGGILIPIPILPIVFSYMFIGPPVLITVVLFETQRFSGSWLRTKELMAGEWLRLSMYMLTFGLGAAMVQVIATGGALAAVSAGATKLEDVTIAGQVIVLVANTVIRCVMLPYFSAVCLIAYFDVKVRKEGFDRPALASLRADE
jgi:hypothetical protein